MCQERCISAIWFTRDSLRNVNQMAWLQKIEIYGKLSGAPGTEMVIVLEQTKIDQQFFRLHATRASYQVFFFTKILRLKQITKILCANELIYLKYITLQSFKIAWKLCIKQISFGRVWPCWTQLDVFGRDFRSLPLEVAV